MVRNNNKYIWIAVAFFFAACKIPTVVSRTENKETPASFNGSQDSTNTASLSWKAYFQDTYLVALIDTALRNNQELNITLQEIGIARNEIRVRKGEYLPYAGVKAGGGIEKVGRYTSQGANDANTAIKSGKSMPDPLGDIMVGVYANWEIDIWKKLHNAKKAAVNHYIASIDGKNFVITNLIAEVAHLYYELLVLDNQLNVVQQNVELQSNALAVVKIQKETTRVTELAVKRFEAEVLSTQSIQYAIQQQITETENKLNFLLARYPQPIARSTQELESLVTPVVKVGVPSQLLINRPDIRRAEQELAAVKLDVQIARAKFLPSVGITAGVGYRAFNPAYLVKTPESLLYSLAGDLTAPLINRNAIKAAYYTANSKQIQAVLKYEQTVLNAYLEVVNQMSNVSNLEQTAILKAKEVAALNMSVKVSGDLFKSTRADYMEVLLTQRDALESRMELIEAKAKQLNAMVNIYRALGGGWR